ncbi:MAG: di-heme oxidoredictase family protein, partial [Phycisphaerae bacterium]
SIQFIKGELDTSLVEGVDEDLVVRPFGRKGEFPTTRSFDQDAMRFHFGMEPVEVVGENVDADQDGVLNEITVGEMSSLEIFNTNLERPVQRFLNTAADAGFKVFKEIGCADCHVPSLITESTKLTYSFPEIADDPDANVFFESDLSRSPAGFDLDPDGDGLIVPLFADLKRHDMGPALAESFGNELDSHFTTARLWGVADTAPYLHDGRALTITEAITMHGGEAQDARDAFVDLDDQDKQAVLAFLRTLRTPPTPARDLTSPR